MAEAFQVALEDLLECVEGDVYADLPYFLVETQDAGRWRWGSMSRYIIKRTEDGKYFAGIVKFTNDGPEDSISYVDMHEVKPVEVTCRKWQRV